MLFSVSALLLSNVAAAGSLDTVTRGILAGSISAQRDNHTTDTAGVHAAYMLLACCLHAAYILHTYCLQSFTALPVVLQALYLQASAQSASAPAAEQLSVKEGVSAQQSPPVTSTSHAGVIEVSEYHF